jgi:tetratricopeptide (TPR) repeat protein
VLDTRAFRIVFSLAVALLFYGALFTGYAPAPTPAAAGAASGLATDVAKSKIAEAQAAIDRGDYVTALRPALALHEALPFNHIYVEQLATIYHHLNRSAEEAAMWEEYLLKAPNPVAACPHLGLAYRAQGNEDKAVDAFARCLAFDPSNPDSILYLALAEERGGRTEKAAELYKRGLALAPTYPDLHLGLARIDLRAGRVADAKSVALLVLKSSPDNTDALFVAGLACLRSGELAKARTYLERGLALSPGNGDLTQALAQVAAREGR